MRRIDRCDLPAEALLRRYLGAGNHADCYSTGIDGTVSHAAFVEAFYTTGVFRIERLILRLAVSRPSTDAEARQLAEGARDAFAAWTVEARAANQLLLADYSGRTRSWLMVAPLADGAGPTTRLYFGSAVVAGRGVANGRSGLGFAFRALLGFHHVYSRVLLGAARARLSRAMARTT